MDLIQNNNRKLFLIRLAHTLIWAFFVCVIGYILCAGIFDELAVWVWIAIGLVVLEGVVLMFNHGSCPLTPIAAKYTHNRDANFDIFLPNWVAKNNKIIFSSIWLLGVAIVVYRVLT
ncbi:MAG: hypothetical protein ALAOOOJD_02998 [bacterium]|nr:hypothetical protein [bacterium]